MRVLSLTQSVLSPDSLPLLPPINTHFSLSSSLHKQSPQLSFRRPNSIPLSRQRARCVMHEALFDQSLQKVSNKSDDTALCYLDFKATKTAAETTQHCSYALLEKNVLERNCHLATDILTNIPVHNIAKFMMLLGLLAILDTGPALAAPDIASGLQSLPFFGDLGDISSGFASAFLLIFFSELGDKTFFIAALLAARNSSGVVFTGTFGALAVMTIISVVLGRTFHYVDAALPFRFGETDLPIDDLAAVCLLVYFGVSTLLDTASSDGLKAEDEQKEAELAVSKFSGNGAGILAAANTVISTFVLVFVAEWGDKSFFSTIALAAASSPLGVIGGALAGHAIATLIAVLGGSLLGTFLSEKVIAYVGGSLFLVFAAVTLFEILT